MATLPTRLVEVEFDAGVWTDVFADVVSVSTRRGRNRELGAFETGSLAVTVRNDARKYDPQNTAGPYYGKLRPNRRVRIRATYNAITYPVFVGYIDRITQVDGGPNDATATFTVSDFFKLLNRAELPVSVYAAEVGNDGPMAWYRLDEPVGSTVAVDAVAGANAAVEGTVVFGAATPIVRDAGVAMNPQPVVVGGTSAIPAGIRVPTVAFPQGTAAFTFEFWLSTTTATTADVPILAIDGGDDFRVGISTFGVTTYLYVRFGAVTNIFAGTVNDGAPHHIAVTRPAAGANLTVYIDGVSAGTLAVGAGASLGPYALFGSPGGTPTTISTAFVLDEFAVYSTVLAAGRVAAHNTAARTPWTGDLPGTRLGRIFDLAAVPAADRLIDAGTTTLQATDLGGTALAYAQKVEETELGWLFVARDGKVRFIGRQAGMTAPYLTSLATVVDDDSGAGLPYRATSSDVDESTIVTRATASREGSVAVTVYDAAAKTEFGWLDENHDGLLHDADTYSRYYAEWILNTHKAPGSRVGAVTLELTKDPANLYPGILALELGDRITYKRKPQNVGAIISVDMRVEAISHETGGHYWRTTLQLSPFGLAGGYAAGVWDASLWDQAVWGF